METVNKLSAPISILCVEDDTVNRELLHIALTGQFPDMAVYCAENGAEGLQLFKQYRPRIVITDIIMPIMDGLQMAIEIRLLDPEAIIIAITAYSDKTFLIKAIEIGINQYIQKPFDTITLFVTISKCIGAISAKNEVRTQNNKIKNISMEVENSHSSVVITDANGTIEYINQKFTKQTGYSSDEAIGLNMRILKSGFTTLGTYTELWRTISSGDTWRGELKNRKKNGNPYWSSLAISPIHEEDGPIAIPSG